MYYVYKFTNKFNKVLYIGRTKELDRRMMFHFSPSEFKLWKNNIDSIEYIEFELYGDSVIYETYLIHILKPIYNRLGIEEGVGTSFKLPELKWIIWKKENAYKKSTNKHIDSIRENMSIGEKWKPKCIAKETDKHVITILRYLQDIGYSCQKEYAIASINEAIIYLNNNNEKVTRKRISEIAGMTYNSILNYNRVYKFI